MYICGAQGTTIYLCMQTIQFSYIEYLGNVHNELVLAYTFVCSSSD